MKSFKTLAALIILMIGTAALINRSKTARHQRKLRPLGKGFVVLELFTSEGCSCCPAADELLVHIQLDAVAKPIYVLAYHVDYWNGLGWKDSFSIRIEKQH